MTGEAVELEHPEPLHRALLALAAWHALNLEPVRGVGERRPPWKQVEVLEDDRLVA